MAASPSRPSLVVAGGGIAGVEALLGVHRHLGDRCDVTLVSPGEDFVYHPLAVGRPFSVARPLRVPLERIAADAGARLVQGAVERIDLDRRRMRTAEGETLTFDVALLALGARAVPGVPGATTWMPHGPADRFGGLLRDLEEGYASRVAFVVPPGPTWPLPAYELALMTVLEAEGMGQEVTCHVVTPERRPLGVFGDRASEATRAELDRAGVRLHTGSAAEVRGGRPRTVALVPGGEELEVDRVVGLPLLTGPELEGAPLDDLGFLRVDDRQRVGGSDHVFAAGDGTDYPVKYGGLATHQARRALTGIAAAVGGTVPDEPATPQLRGVLMVGRRARALADADERTPAGAPLWTPDGKVAGTYLPGYLNEVAGGAVAGEEAAPAAGDGEAVQIDEPLGAAHVAEAAYLTELARAARLTAADLRRADGA